MVTGAELRYQRGAAYGDTVRVTAWIDSMRSRSLKFGYEVRREEELLVSGSTTHLWTDARTGRTCRTPEVVREPFARLAVEPARGPAADFSV